MKDNLTKGGYIATPRADITPAQRKAAESSGWTTTSAPTPTSGTRYSGGSSLPTLSNFPIETTPNAQDIGKTNPYVLPQRQVVNPTNVVTAGNASLAPSLSPLGYTQDKNGQFIYTAPKTDTPTVGTDTQSSLNRIQTMLGMVPKKESVYNDSAIINQQRQIEQNRATVNSLTGNLNAIVAKSQADQLSLVGQGRGQTEAYIGGVQAQINREAAIAALPVQAQVAIAQGNLALAQDHLDTLTKIRTEEVNNEYSYRTQLYSSVKEYLTKEEERQYEQIKIKDTRAYNEKIANIESQDAWQKLAVQNDQGNLISQFSKLDPSSTTFRQELGKVTSQMRTSSGGNNNITTDNERALLSNFNSSPIVKDYNIIVAQKLSTDNIIKNGVGGPADLAVVFSFMKGLDPNSVVRETEYKTAATSGNIFAGVFAKFNGYFKEEGGFLPESVKGEFQNLVNQKLLAQQQQYNNFAKGYRDIATRQGLNPDNVVVNYGGALTGDTTQNTPVKDTTIKSNGQDYIVGKVYNDGTADWIVDSKGKWTKK